MAELEATLAEQVRQAHAGHEPLAITAGGSTIRALRLGLRALHDGQLVGVFPEGRVFTDEEPGPVNPGAALLAVQGRVPVVPMYIDGSARAWPQDRSLPRISPVRVRVGRPIDPPGRNGRNRVGDLVRRIEDAWRSLAGGEDG